MRHILNWIISICLVQIVQAYHFDPQFIDWNLNENPYAFAPTDYWGQWSGHEYTPSPVNWRFPFYTIMPDRFVNGDPFNDNINGTYFEHDIRANQMRHAGDIQGIAHSLDYIQGMGIKGLYLAGSPFLNAPWEYDQYSPVDLSLMDWHLGNIQQWRDLINDIHARGMYVILDNTFATLGDLIGFDSYLNTTAPFWTWEHQVQYTSDRQYWDFAFGNDYNATCDYPPFWNETGYPVDSYVTAELVGCYNSDFDQYGDTEAFGVFPDWRRELSKFASVQDRLREWHPPVRAKLENFYCMLIAQLDVDGFRYDKATQSTVDAMGSMNNAMRQCARRFGKNNFFLPGEITGGNTFGSVFIGRGRQPNMLPSTINDAIHLTNVSSSQYFLREAQNSALDSAAFHYTVYRTLTRVLGMDGNLASGYDAPLNWVDMWNTFLLTNDFINAETGEFDPRHMYGVTNQDVFRWPAIQYGAQRQLLGHFITTLLMPGIPLVLWGEEQAFYILDNTADNYIFGRQPMSSATAWQDHGCYHLGSAQYYQWPVEAARFGCDDDAVSYDHRDPSAPIRNILKHMYHLRETYPVLNDGFFLQQLSNMTEQIYYPGSSGVPTETGFWSVVRTNFNVVPGFTPIQDLALRTKQSHATNFTNFVNATDFGNSTKFQNETRFWNTTLPKIEHWLANETIIAEEQNELVWLLFSNVNRTQTFTFDCQDTGTYLETHALVSPFEAGAEVKNLLPPYDEITLLNSSTTLGLANSTKPNGCMSSITMPAYSFRAYVLSRIWQPPRPMITKFSPGHDARILSTVNASELEEINVSLEFSMPMNCSDVTRSLSFDVSIGQTQLPNVKDGSVTCSNISVSTIPDWSGAIKSTWSWSATLEHVPNGIFSLAVQNASDANGTSYTNSVDRFMLRIGQANNPMVFTRTANYSRSLVSQDSDGGLILNHAAEGADLWRYSTNWGTSYSEWMPYAGGSTPIQRLGWNGTSEQAWDGTHVHVEYWSKLSGSSDHVQAGDVNFDTSRHYPHLFLEGPFNQYGYDAGVANTFQLVDNNTWKFYFMTEWPAVAQVNVWGVNPDGIPDQTYVMGDVDEDSVLDRMPPSALAPAVLNITKPPPRSNTGWILQIDDGTNRYAVLPAGSPTRQLALFILLWVIPLITASASVWIYMKSFYAVKFEKFGLVQRGKAVTESFFGKTMPWLNLSFIDNQDKPKPDDRAITRQSTCNLPGLNPNSQEDQLRRKVLIATMEYDIEDWQVKVKIGGLGVMAQLMGKNLGHQDLIWVVPCVDGIDYPIDEPAHPMHVKILGKVFKINVQYHALKNITYVLLDAPTFRQQTKAEPYPARMDDLDSAIYYSAWNQCIAQAIERFQPDLYHINDYHGSIAPLYLLPSTIPVCLSLHNAEFQGLWPMRTRRECEEVSDLFNLPMVIVQQFVQFGEIFNLLHAGASYLRVYQQGFGAVGVSKKYGVRSYLRYPIFWGLKKVGQLPNPDPSDTGEWDKKLPKEEDITVDPDFEAARPELKRQAQEWANLDLDPDAELFVFVGRWSTQKGIDLIADVFPSVLENYKHAQLICIGPVIDLHGKFAAAKLERMMKVYPGRVFSRPVFTALPPYIFSGAEFALIPSRDEPFGLVAVEFGRKGALGVGARVGGLGQMPGWWYTVESMEIPHLLVQFRQAIEEAINSKQETRAMMRARSAKQRFPVAQWVEDLEILQSTAIKVHQKKTYAILEGDEPKPERARRRLKRRERREKRLLEADGRWSLSDVHPWEAESTVAESHAEDEPTLVFDQVYSDDETDVFDMAERSLANGGSDDSRTVSFLHPNAGYTWPAPSSEPTLKVKPSLEPSLSVTPFSEASSNEVEIAIAEHVHLRVPSSPREVQAPIPVRPVAAEILESVNSSTLANANTLTELTSISRRESESIPLLGTFGTMPPSTLETSYPASPFPWGSPEMTRPTSRASNSNQLSGKNVVGERRDYRLQKVDPFFTDPTGQYYKQFQKKLEDLEKDQTDSSMRIGEYLTRSEKKFYGELRNAKLGLRRRPQIPSGLSGTTVATLQAFVNEAERQKGNDGSAGDLEKNGFVVEVEEPEEETYAPVSPLKRFMQRRVGDWPIYAIFLAVGQVIAANSYQIVILTGQVGENAQELYILCSIYIVATLAWWLLFRWVGSRPVLCLPYLFYGLAFLLVGLAHYAPLGTPRSWVNHVGVGLYSWASASGSFYFVLNFGDEGGSQVRAWVFRACVIQGTQQVYIAVLWLWGTSASRVSASGVSEALHPFADTPYMTVIGILAAIVLWSTGFLIYHGLPSYYLQQPGSVPDFYKSSWKRKILMCFFFMVLIQNFFLSPQYGRSWGFLFNSAHLQAWQIFLLVFLFFVVVWVFAMWGFTILAHSHTWILPIFAIGLGAPRWAQIWWGTSNMGQWLPWAPGGYIGSGLLSRAVWLWLGVLDSIQGVGLGMILLSTLTRVHVLFTLVVAQVIGAATTAFARAVAPDRLSPGAVFPDITGDLSGLENGWFWIGLILNLSICIGYFKYFRKEQLTKP